ncbi:transcriptional regulator [Microbulbifer sp. A4B17]|uniref:transcriptional regulator n=1 Tax=Microbulbifer sp. A4B17 TaxID=359370 RepID=UPI000D52ED2A|nr:transcriptional regulator [Microbulbifer sp. A4B17]AWF80917.1 transcriptional regulator [Microbulbifer sp. A4B17]
MQQGKHSSPHNEAIDHTKLPDLMQDLIELIGYADMYALISTFGGQDVYIPKYPSRSKLVDILPVQSLEKLSTVYGGTYLTLPTSRQINIQKRNQEILLALHNGDSRSTVAKRFGLGVRQVANIKSTEKSKNEK